MTNAAQAHTTVGLTIDTGVVTACASISAALLAASLIVLSLVRLEGEPGTSFSLVAEARKSAARGAVNAMQLTIWASGLGTELGLGALVWPRGGPRWAAFASCAIAAAAFLWMAVVTVRAVSVDGEDA